ncbi:MAG: SLBB domain-containing protein [candidate division WOR-3 bacterium]|nr:SLBB domain-containing protein [candidate division WOR-3 bacterium]
MEIATAVFLRGELGAEWLLVLVGLASVGTGVLLVVQREVVAGWALAQPAQSQAPVFKYYVWGQVRSPGAYSLGANPDILELLSTGGGPTEYANLRRVVLVRAVTQKRINVNLKKMLDAGPVVPLYPGDVVIVPHSAWYYFRDGLTVVTSVGTAAILVLTLMNWGGK